MDDLLNHAQQLANQAPTPIIQPIEGRVAYLVNQGHGTANGNTQQLAEALNRQGLETLCMVRPGWPWDAEGKGNDLITPESDINGVRYLYSTLPSSASECARATLEATVEKLIKLLRVYRPTAVLTETTDVGLGAWIAAKRLGLTIYGMGPSQEDVTDEKVLHCLFVAKQAEYVFVNNRQVKSTLVKNGVKEESIEAISKNVDSVTLPLVHAKRLASLLEKTKGIETVIESQPLKRYTSMPALSVNKSLRGRVKTKKSEDIIINPGNSFEIKQKVEAGEEYSLIIKCLSSSENPKGSVADVTFYDKEGRMLPKPYPGMSKSKAFGSYFYIATHESVTEKAKNHTFLSPKNAVEVSIKIVAFGVKSSMTLAGGYRLISNKERLRESAKECKYIESFNEILLEAESIPDSNGTEYFSKHSFRVGVIGDVYMYNFYKDVFNEVHYLSPSNYSEILAKGIDIFIYTTCWKGINNEEWRGVKFRDTPKNALEKILTHAKENNIKTVFQTIEDPSNFDYFLPIAEKFDYVLTTDTDCIDRYKKELGHDRVYFGEYGVNPQLNNPIGCRRNTRNAAFFAGSYPKRYQERCDDMETIFDSIVDSGGEVLIADRNFGSESDDLVYPDRFQSSVLPPVQHDVLQKLHKLFRYNLNFNSIKQSPTMCAMRIYELQAQGNGFISNYANSVFNKFPGVRIVPYKQDMSFDFCKDETWEEYRVNVSNIREVLDSKTSYQVVSKLLENIGLKNVTKPDKTIAVICSDKTDSVIRSFEAQAYPHKILIEEADLESWEKIKKDYSIGYFVGLIQKIAMRNTILATF